MAEQTNVRCTIIGCPEWDARPPRNHPVQVGKARRIIFHHTAGHGIDLPPAQDRAEAIKYAQAIQSYHMSQGWNDSGHNFLVMRSGVIVQGRWRSVSWIKEQKMVLSAHCPGQNEQIGIEHEHQGQEKMTARQLEASARLMAWIAGQYARTTVLPVEPHSRFFATSCPANLKRFIPEIKWRAQEILDQANL